MVLRVSMESQVYRLLACCARAECTATHDRCLARAAANLQHWEGVAAQAELHGVAPLLYVHSKAAGVQIPLSTRRELQGLYVRHRQANRIRMRLLGDVLAAYQSAGIAALILKGAALCQLVYREPGLRPMSDIDILVAPSQARRAQQVLADLGFDAPKPRGAAFPHRHLHAATTNLEGVSVALEIHHRLFSDYWDNLRSYVHNRFVSSSLVGIAAQTSAPQAAAGWHGMQGVTDQPQSFSLGELTVYTLSYEDTLGYLCRHLTSHVNVWDFARLIWVADIVSFAERFAGAVDWGLVRRRYPAVPDTLSLLHFLTPLSDELLSLAGIKTGSAPQGIGMEFQGWPRAPLATGGKRGYLRLLRDTLLPSEWWLRLRYALGSGRSLFWYRWLRHPLYIVGHVARAFLERLGWPTPLELARGPEPK
jgi:hypothetical protein